MSIDWIQYLAWFVFVMMCCVFFRAVYYTFTDKRTHLAATSFLNCMLFFPLIGRVIGWW